MKRVSILGASGSIGASTLDVISAHPETYKVAALAGGSNVAKLADAALKTKAEFVAIADESQGDELKSRLAGTGCEIGVGDAAVLAAAEFPTDLAISAIVGFAGLAPTLKVIEQGATLALANKESLVCAGSYVMEQARRANVAVLPVDSEHNAIFQAMNGASLSDIEMVTITASGGPFRSWSADAIKTATIADALNHPNWSMGRKITVDSASLMNKGLELIEAGHLFGIGLDKLRVIVHPSVDRARFRFIHRWFCDRGAWCAGYANTHCPLPCLSRSFEGFGLAP